MESREFMCASRESSVLDAHDTILRCPDSSAVDKQAELAVRGGRSGGAPDASFRRVGGWLQPFCNRNAWFSSGFVGTAWDSGLTISLGISDFLALAVTIQDLPSHPVGLIRLDGEDDVQRYAKTIRAWHEANDGRSADRPSGGRALAALT